MKKSDRQIEALINSLAECVAIEHVIENLPRGYISVKVISGHTYYYRQWREGSKIISCYVPETYLNVVRQKIAIRKQNEELLRILKKDYKKAERNVLKNNLLTSNEVEKINKLVRNMNIDENTAPDEVYNAVMDSLQ